MYTIHSKIISPLWGIAILCLSAVFSCTETETPEITTASDAFEQTFSSTVDLNNLENYANQSIPNYITKDNTDTNQITDEGATLGRVLFYDKNLSVDNTIACASCHQQKFAFSDKLQASEGVAGFTGRHSMRLINSRFSDEGNFFWDERASSLEEQTTMPIQDHIEMGFSGADGDPSIDDMIDKLGGLEYYDDLFQLAYESTEISEEKLQQALAQFIRSIQSFDSKYDIGRAQATNDNSNFPNFTTEENQGKSLFMTPPNFNQNGVRIGGGAGCGGCHRAPEFDIDPQSRNNGVTATIDGGTDTSITRAPTLRDMVNPDGSLNGDLMHTGTFTSLAEVIGHYDHITTNNTNLDRRLNPRGGLQQLALSQQEVLQLEAFLLTLTGSDVYVNEKWSSPFE